MKTLSQVLTPQQIEQFITRGWTKVEAAFPREQGVKVQEFLWHKLAVRGVIRDEPNTWRKPMESINESYDGSPFDECATARLAAAVSDLVGAGRWIAERETGWWGWWPVNFSVGADREWDVPSGQWHIDTPDDGTFITAPDQGSLAICLFSDLAPRGGGTLICEGSHQVAIRFMKENPNLTQNEFNRACPQSHPYLRALTERDGDTERVARFMDESVIDDWGTSLRVVEITGNAGDVFLAHPFLFHSPSSNHSGTPRFMCNRKTPLFEPMQLEREDGDYSALEESIRRALDVAHIESV